MSMSECGGSSRLPYPRGDDREPRPPAHVLGNVSVGAPNFFYRRRGRCVRSQVNYQTRALNYLPSPIRSGASGSVAVPLFQDFLTRQVVAPDSLVLDLYAASRPRVTLNCDQINCIIMRRLRLRLSKHGRQRWKAPRRRCDTCVYWLLPVQTTLVGSTENRLLPTKVQL